MKHRLAALLLACVAAAAACSKPRPAEQEPAAGIAYARADAPVAPPVEGDSGPVRVGGSLATGRVVGGVAGPGMHGQTGLPPGQVPVPQDRKLIRDASAWLEVKAVDQALAALRTLAERSGGYVTSEQRSRDERSVGQGMLVARVPSGKLDSLTDALKSVGTVLRFQLSANDISEELFNLELRLRNQRQLEARLLELLNRPGNRLSDLLETERELARVRSEIDQLEGRQRFWDNRVALSTVTVEVHEPRPAVAGAQGGAWAALKKSFSDAADNFVLAIAGIIAATGALIPIFVVFAVVLYLLVRWWRWRRRRRSEVN